MSKTRTLKKMLHDGPMLDSGQTWAEAIVRRAAEVALPPDARGWTGQQDPIDRFATQHYRLGRVEAHDAILADAGLKDEWLRQERGQIHRAPYGRFAWADTC